MNDTYFYINFLTKLQLPESSQNKDAVTCPERCTGRVSWPHRPGTSLLPLGNVIWQWWCLKNISQSTGRVRDSFCKAACDPHCSLLEMEGVQHHHG